jgi:hypothetical protein
MLKDEYHELINEGTTDRDPGLDSAIRETDNFLSSNENLKQRHEMHLLPVQAYLHFPKLSDQIQINPKDEKDILRLLFKNVEYTKYEKNKLQELYENLKKLNSKNKGILLPLWWDDSESIRFLQASEFNIKKTITTITSQINWTDSFYPFQLTDNIKLILNSGLMYMCGRDKNFRPIIIVKASKISYLVEKLKIKMEDIQKATAYFLNYIIIYQMIPGQLENWLIISDVSKVGITEFGYFKKLMDILSKFRGRVYRNFIIGMNVILRSCAKGALAIFGSSSKKKIKFVDKKEIFEELQKYVDIEYIPQIYGGNQIQLEFKDNNLFPPNFNILNLNNIPKDIMSEDEYKNLCFNSSKSLIICPQLKQKWNDEEKRKKMEEEKQKIIKDKKREIKEFDETSCVDDVDTWINIVKEFQTNLLIPDEGKNLNKYKPFLNDDDDLNHCFTIKHVKSAYYFE